MSSMWRKAMLYLGLGPDEEYDDGRDDSGRGAPTNGMSRNSGHPGSHQSGRQEASDAPGNNVRPITPQPLESNMKQQQHQQQRSGSGVRPIPATPRPYVVAPKSFEDAQEVGDKFKGNVPVIVNLQDAKKDLTRRLIDFCSGLCYALGGDMSRVAQNVFLLTPSNVEVSAEDRRKLQERGLYD